jgi:hypothetical protein
VAPVISHQPFVIFTEEEWIIMTYPFVVFGSGENMMVVVIFFKNLFEHAGRLLGQIFGMA